MLTTRQKKWQQTTRRNNNLLVSMCVRVCRASRLGMDWPSGIVAVCAASSKARFMPMGVCWNPGSLIQPSCIENKTKSPAADISMGNPLSLHPSLLLSFLSLYIPVHVPPTHKSVTCPQDFCALVCCYGNDSAQKRRDVKSWLWGKTEKEKTNRKQRRSQI